jgi:outer membrane protein OmpA-like peptidoglycan-associated protein
MLQAPTNDRKTKADASAKTAERLPEEEQSLQLLGGLGQARQSQPLQQRNKALLIQGMNRWLEPLKMRSRSRKIIPLSSNPRNNLAGLQKAYGNQAVLRMKGRSPAANPVQGGVLQRKCACGNVSGAAGTCAECQQKQALPLQTKLKINEPGDRYEQEADRIADQVMRMPEPSIQRQMEPEEEKEGMVQRKAIGERVAPLDTKQESFEVPPIVYEVLNSPGYPLDFGTRVFMESRFGHDFSQVRVHTDAKAAESAQATHALAYTAGQDVVFGTGQYLPNTITGQKLLAHELVHTLQQRQTISNAPHRMELASANTMYEQEATQISDIVTSERSTRTDVTMSASSSIQRTCKPAEIGSVSGCIGQGGEDIFNLSSTDENLYLFHVGCDDFKPGAEDRLRQLAATITPDETVEEVDIDGFASEEGSPDFNDSLSCARAHKAASILSSEGIALDHIQLYKHGSTSGSRDYHRSVVINVRFRPKLREIQSGEQALLERLAKLGHVAGKEGTGGEEFKKAVNEFRSTLKQRLEELKAGDPLPTDLQLIMKALWLWSRDSGKQWGQGWLDSDDLIMSAPQYATVPAHQYKCNAYVAEVLYQSLGVVQEVHKQVIGGWETGKYFPYRAKEWGNASFPIPHFQVVHNPKMGDIWADGSHTGIYLGTYMGKRLSISARDDGDGVFGLKAEVQEEHGIQIKYLPEGGVYRQYTP